MKLVKLDFHCKKEGGEEAGGLLEGAQHSVLCTRVCSDDNMIIRTLCEHVAVPSALLTHPVRCTLTFCTRHQPLCRFCVETISTYSHFWCEVSSTRLSKRTKLTNMTTRLIVLGLAALSVVAVHGNPTLRSPRQTALQKLATDTLRVAVPGSATHMAAILEDNLREERAKKKALGAQVNRLKKELDGILRPATGPVGHAADTGDAVHDEVRGNEQPYKDEKLVNEFHGKSSANVWGGENPGA